MSKIDEARNILDQLGLPPAQRNDISCLTLLALAGISEDSAWSELYKPSLTIHQILGFMKETYSGSTRRIRARRCGVRSFINLSRLAWWTAIPTNQTFPLTALALITASRTKR